MIDQVRTDAPQPSVLTNTLLSKLPPVLYQALKLAVIPYWFDEPLLAALRGDADADGRTGKILEKLISFSFVSAVSEGRYAVTQDMRTLLRLRWLPDRAEFSAANLRAAEHLATRAAGTSGPEAEELEQARVYHLLAADGDAGVAALCQVFDAIEETQRKALAERLVTIAEEQRLFLQPAHQAWLDYFQARLHQLYGRWEASRPALEPMLQRDDLPSLHARVQQAAAETLVHQGQWVQAIQMYRQAVDDLEEQDDPNAALVMLDLGQTYVDMAISMWGQRHPHPHVRSLISQRALDLVGVLGRLPILAYLALGLGPGVLRSTLSLALHLDWMIARLFVYGAQWYRRGGARLAACGHVTGQARLQERLARLYHSLGHRSGADEMYRRLLAQTDPPPDEYRRSRAQLGLGHVLLDQGRPSRSAPLLEQALPTLAAYDDVPRQAQAHNLLGQARAALGQADAALEHYGRALALYRATDDVVGQTNVAHQLEEWAGFQDTPAPAREQAVQIAAGVTRRRYLARYTHPMLAVFRTMGLWLLGIVFFCTAFLSIRAETSAELWVRSTIAVSALGSPSSAQPPVIVPASMQNLRLSVVPDVALAGAALILGVYTLLYIGLGAYLIARTPLRAMQEGQSPDLIADEQGLSRGRRAIPWFNITSLFSIDRKLGRQPLPSFSRTVVFSPHKKIEISGNTGWYTALAGQIARRAPGAARHDLGYSVIYSLAGIVFIASLLGLGIFMVLAAVQPGMLEYTLSPTPYPLADLRALCYAGLLAALTWWLIVAPLRAEVVLNRSRGAWPWGVLAAGLALAGAAWLRLDAWRVEFGLSGVIPAVYAVCLTWIGAWAVRLPGKRSLVILAVAGLITLPAGWTIARQVLAYHALMQGNVSSLRGRELQAANPTQAEVIYRRALDSYTRALALNPADAAAYAGRGIVYGQMGQLEEALADYSRSLQIAPRQPSVLSNRAIIYEAQAVNARRSGDTDGMQTAYQQAITDLSAAIELAPRVTRYYVQRGMIYLAMGQPDEALADFQAAQQLAPNNPDALNGLGWINYQAGRQALLNSDRTLARQAFEQAAQAFQVAAALDSQNLNNVSGMGWAYRELGDLDRNLAKTEEIQGNLVQANQAWQQALENYDKVRAAFERASEQSPDTPQYHVSYGHALWLVSTYYNSCDPDKQAVSPAERQAYIEMIRQAIQEIGVGIALYEQSPGALDRNVATYYAEQAHLSYILYRCKGDDKLDRLNQAIAYYTQAIEASPDRADYYNLRGRLTYVLGVETSDREAQARIYEQAVQDMERAILSAPDNIEYATWLGYAVRAGASSYFELGRSRLRSNREAALQDYVRGITLARKLNADARRGVLDTAVTNLEKLAGTHPELDADIQTIIELLRAAQ